MFSVITLDVRMFYYTNTATAAFRIVSKGDNDMKMIQKRKKWGKG